MMRRLRNSPLAPWAGLFLGAAGWSLHHQIGSDANDWNCHAANGAFVVGVGVVCALVAAAGGLLSWSAAAQTGQEPQNRGFARIVGMAGAAVFLLAIGFQTLAGFLIPACLR